MNIYVAKGTDNNDILHYLYIIVNVTVSPFKKSQVNLKRVDKGANERAGRQVQAS